MNEDTKPGNSKSLVRNALSCLVLGATASGCTPAASSGKLSVKDVAQPENTMIDLTGKQWKEVTIELTESQKAELKSRGVDTNVVKITTFDLSRLGTMSHN